jgi:hypothetical protein
MTPKVESESPLLQVARSGSWTFYTTTHTLGMVTAGRLTLSTNEKRLQNTHTNTVMKLSSGMAQALVLECNKNNYDCNENTCIQEHADTCLSPIISGTQGKYNNTHAYTRKILANAYMLAETYTNCHTDSNRQACQITDKTHPAK